MRKATGCPVYRPDIYSTAAILDPHPHYGALRQMGAVVWLAKQRVYAVPRYTECKAILRDDKTFTSGQGVALNPIANRLSRGTTLNSDGIEHDQRRKLVAHRLLPRALRAITKSVETRAASVVESAVRRGEIDGVRDLACALPMAVVPDFVGWPHNQRHMLRGWAAATFDALGPFNGRAIRAAPASLGMLHYAHRAVRERSVIDDSMGHDLLLASDIGKLSSDECSALMIDYLAPSLDTTISGIATALALFATHPDQWRLLRGEPTLLPNAINEILRYESPVRAFARKVAKCTAIGGVEIPTGARVVLIYASANRDEREWIDPDTFDISRDANRQLGFGHGAHACAGQGLARVEMQAILTALMQQVSRIELAGQPTWALNNVIRCYDRLPLALVAA